MNPNELLSKAKSWKKVGYGSVVIAVLAAALAFFSFHKAKVYEDQAAAMMRASDSVDGTIKTAPKGDASITEHGAWAVVHTRPCQPGMKDVTPLRKVTFDENECGETEEVASNWLTDDGERYILDCFYRSNNCPTAFTMALLSTNAGTCSGGVPQSPLTEQTAWSSVSTYELTSAVSTQCPTTGCPGYTATALARNTGGDWGAPVQIVNGSGGCTEAYCWQTSTKQVTLTASSGAWGGTARFIVIRMTIGGSEYIDALACLNADRILMQNDALNLTYRQAMQ